jgi:hypothetical protein
VFRKSQLRRLQQRSSSLSSFPLAAGGRYYYDYDVIGGQVWAYALGFMIRSKYGFEVGEEPEILQKIRQAKDPIAAIEPFRPDDPDRALVDPLLLLQEPSHESDVEAPESAANPWDGFQTTRKNPTEAPESP